jgi:hypothetical protein
MFGVPGVILIIAWRRLFRNWQRELHETADLTCLILASGSAALAIASSAWEVLVRPIPPHHSGVLIWAWTVSCAAVVAGLIPKRGPHGHFGLGLMASFWMPVAWSITAFRTETCETLRSNCRNIAIALIDLWRGVTYAMACSQQLRVATKIGW